MLTPASAVPPVSPDSSAGAFLSRLTHLVREAATQTQSETHQRLALPLEERIAKGRAIADVRVVEVVPGGILRLACLRNESRFREGDVLCLHRGNPYEPPSLLVTLEFDDEIELLVSIEDPSSGSSPFLTMPDGWVLDEGFLDISNFVLEALHAAADTANGRERVLPLLMGKGQPQIDSERFEYAIARAEEWGLNDSQAEALAMAYATDLAYLIQGPPGTGKTQVLARLAQLLAEEGQRVLVTAFTHRAINNALNKLAELTLRPDGPPLMAIKVARRLRHDDLLVDCFERFESSPLAEQSGGYIVGATPFATRTVRLGGIEFDTVIFDEASQITLPLAVMGMLPARRFIFVGDQYQLPPVLATREGDQLLCESVFGALVNHGFDTMLEETYRLNDALAAWPSEQFYQGRLRPTATAAARRIVYPLAPERLVEALDPSLPKVFIDLGHINATTRCEAEARLVADLIVALLECGIVADEIGVVTPFRAQSRAIRTLLRRALPDINLRRKIVVDTVERMQGQERELIIVSLTTSSLGFASDMADFLFQSERLNVTMTRARTKLIVLGSRHLLQARPSIPDQIAGVTLLRSFLESCESVVLPSGQLKIED